MIASKDRSGWIGASDTAMVMGNWSTPTFERWWAVKLGIARDDVRTRAMTAGTHWEGRVLDALGIKKRNRQIKLRHLRLRVNLDGETDIIHEVKTHKSEVFKLSKAYWQQAQVEMFASGKRLVIDAYRLTPEDYDNFYRELDERRLTHHPVPYDFLWVTEQYLPRLRILAKALRKGVFPDALDGQAPGSG